MCLWCEAPRSPLERLCDRCRDVPFSGQYTPVSERYLTQRVSLLEIRHSLLLQRKRFIEVEWGEKWPGFEFAKALAGKSIDMALADINAQLQALRA
jgi:hypothetical protein